MTAGTQAWRAASSRKAWIAPGHASGSPIGSPLASITPVTTRYPTQDLPVGDQIMLLSRRRAKYPSESRSPYLPSRSLIRPASCSLSRDPWPGRAQEQVGRHHHGEHAERAGEQVEQVGAGLRHELDRPGYAHQAEQHVLDPLPQRVVLDQAARQQDVGQPDRHIGDHQAGEDPGRPPPGPRVALRVELVPEDQQQHQGGGGGVGPDPDVVGGVHHVDDDAEREQQRDRLPGPALALAGARGRA